MQAAPGRRLVRLVAGVGELGHGHRGQDAEDDDHDQDLDQGKTASRRGVSAPHDAGQVVACRSWNLVHVAEIGRSLRRVQQDPDIADPGGKGCSILEVARLVKPGKRHGLNRAVREDGRLACRHQPSPLLSSPSPPWLSAGR
jgi:hypothetical protein